MTVLFEMCCKGFHESCIRFGPPPNTFGGRRVECCCPCHPNGDPYWKASDADRMAMYFAFEHRTDPRVEQIVEGKPAPAAKERPQPDAGKETR